MAAPKKRNVSGGNVSAAAKGEVQVAYTCTEEERRLLDAAAGISGKARKDWLREITIERAREVLRAYAAKEGGAQKHP